MEEVYRLIKETYFTLLFMLLVQIATATISTIHRKKFSELKNFRLYAISGLIQTIFSLLAMLIFASNQDALIYLSISLFVVFEFLILYFFAFNIIIGEIERLILKILFVFFVLYVASMWTFTEAILNHYEIYLVQSVVLFILPVLYFIQLFKLPSSKNPISQPAFWINIGMLFFFSSTIPLFILEMKSRHFITHNYYPFSISYAAYGIFYLLICKAYLCKTVTKLDYSLS